MCNARAGVWDARIETVRGFADAITERDVMSTHMCGKGNRDPAEALASVT